MNTGEVSGLIESRSDLTKFASACRTLENATPLVEGGAKKMPGTYFAGATANGGSMFTGSIAPAGLSSAATVLDVTAINYGAIQPGQTLIGSGVSANTAVLPWASFTGSISGTTLTVSSVSSGSLAVGQILLGAGLAGGLYISALGTGRGSTGTYTVSTSSGTIGSEAMTAGGTGVGGSGTYSVTVSQTVASEQMQTASSGKSRLVPFQFSTAQGAVLEMSAGIVRVWEGSAEGDWSLGLAQQVPDEASYNPATAYVSGNVALVGPTFLVFVGPGAQSTDTAQGRLYVSAPYGVTNASTVSFALGQYSTDSLYVYKTGTSPNEGIGIGFANLTPSKNAASLIQAAIRALGSLNASSSNYVDLSQWTVTPDSIYYGTPWALFASSESPYFTLADSNWVMECTASNQYDEFPLSMDWVRIGINIHNGFVVTFNSSYWEQFNEANEPPIELSTPYLEGDLFSLDCSTQSADILWIFHPNYPPACVERLSANSWKYSTSLPGQRSGEPPYRGTLAVVKTGYSALGQNISLISQASPCTVVLASSSASQPFQDGDRVYINEGSGLVELNEGEFLVSGIAYGAVSIHVIDSTGTASTVSATGWYMNLIDPSTGVTVDSSSYLQYSGGAFAVKVVAMFSAPGDYPACGTLFQERLFVGGSTNNPTQLNGSTQDDYPDFICDPNADDYAVQYTLVANKLNQLLNMVGTPNGLAIGTAGGIWIVNASSGSSLSQSNVDATLQNGLGVSNLQPQVVNGSAIFVSRSARIVTFLAYNFVTNQWDNTDLTRLNRKITIGTSASTSGIAQTAFQMEPYPIHWSVRNDGQLIGLVFNTQDQVYAWFRVNMTAEGGIIESVAVISGQNQEDQIAIVVNRTINGVTLRFVEYFMPQELFGQLSNAFFVHCGQQLQLLPSVNITGIANGPGAQVTAPGHGFSDGMQVQIVGVQGMTQINQNATQAYTVTGSTLNTFQLSGMDSTSFGVYTGGGTVSQVTNQVSGMSYLMGQEVIAVGDTQVIFEGTVTSDTVVFGSYANQITIGLPYKTTIQPMNPVLGNQQATSKGKKQKFTRATFSLYESIGGQAGTDADHLYDLSYGENSEGNPPELFTGNITRDLDGEWEDDATILIVHSDPYPFCLRSVTPRLSVAEEG
jgi:hypothetical protein